MMKITAQSGLAAPEYWPFLEEALPKLDRTLETGDLGEFRGGEPFIGAVNILAACAQRGIDLSDEAMAEVEHDAHAFADDEWHTYRHLSAKALEYIAMIRSRRDADPATA
ncbi:hypothetical protein GZ998_04430 [Actinomyces sp. 594]|uniref:hypothetical protein n=1 Tax=unclassified Actinomyces TaxID=2609248 RepID=UPI00137B1DFA|nr:MULTISPECIES: hypothetical protein [unclassified Actinomyces]MBW3068760.1 hypothetical protein [Actinomyces sp. 594]